MARRLAVSVQQLLPSNYCPAASMSNSSMPRKGCWGKEICGPNHVCTPDFACKGKHFRDKFCRVCYTCGLCVPVSRVRILADVFHDDFVNSKSGGVWTHFPTHLDAPKRTGDRPITFRLIQQTLKCAGPRLLIFQDDAPHIAALTPLPSDWVTMQGTVRLFIRRGTLSLSPPFPVSANPMDALVQAAVLSRIKCDPLDVNKKKV